MLANLSFSNVSDVISNVCDVITNKQMRRDSSKFKRSIQAKFSTNTGQQNVLGDVTVLQNSQLIVKSTVRHDFSIETFYVRVPIFAHPSTASTKSGSDHRIGSEKNNNKSNNKTKQKKSSNEHLTQADRKSSCFKRI